MKLELFLTHLGNPNSYYPKLTKVTGGVTASVLFFQIFQWQTQLSHPQEWVKSTTNEIEKSTGLSPIEQELARRLLVERSLLKERSITGNSDTLEYWVNIDTLEQKLENSETATYSDIIPYINNATSQVTPDFSSNRTVKTDKFFGQTRQAKTVTITPDYRFSGPWQSDEQLEGFQRALLEYFKNQGHPNPSGCVFKIIDGITKGIASPYWDDFITEKPLGESQKRDKPWEWEIGPNVPYPALEEERTQYYLQKGEPLEAAVSRARADLRNPILGKDLWEGFLRKCDRIADDAMRAKKLGVQAAYLPPSFTEKPQVTKESVMKKLEAISPQFSLESDRQEALIPANVEPQKTEEQESASAGDIPSLESLQAAYKTPMGRSFVENKIAEHPEWGYEIINGKIIESVPF